MTPLCSVLSRDCDIERFDLIKLLALSIRSLILYFSSFTGLILESCKSDFVFPPSQINRFDLVKLLAT
ncbi:hypothetical protein L1987_52564 [Smallanthus sonchifolius]|uniref:Uncharacterized protein n=1 Tax=Smallanthus sonchifolius TaxID=185202 RepID=A0ACB9ETX2_9ASTR|nr:hypothetical protein L1987_52564 [Smallanthus sonchifolius]